METIISNLPTLPEVILHPVSLVIFSLYGLLIIWEFLFPARKLPPAPFWKLRGVTAFMLYFFISSYLPILWNGYLMQYQLFNLTFLGTWWGGLVALFFYQVGLYTWHRTIHKSDLLWKVFHQMHHSAERIDTFGAFYFSPMDMIGFTFITSFCLVVIAGFTPEATALALIAATFLSVFQHTNIKTPQWLGYITQRPEGHTMHHAKGIHAYNYCDLPLIDMMFGTFSNPKKHEGETGFFPGASGKVKDMLKFKDISSGS